MWYDDLPPGKPWTALWSGYILCSCGGIRRSTEACTACGAAPISEQWITLRGRDGREERALVASMGAEGRYEDYVYLAMLEREWLRKDVGHAWLDGMPLEKKPSQRAAIVLLFWSYFETRIERLLRLGMRSAPQPLVDDALSRYSSVGSRMDRLYRVVFGGSSYARDLDDLGYGDVRNHLTRVQTARNDFIHGEPQSIDDELVEAVVANLKREHESWIAVYNRRAVTPPVVPAGIVGPSTAL